VANDVGIVRATVIVSRTLLFIGQHV